MWEDLMNRRRFAANLGALASPLAFPGVTKGCWWRRRRVVTQRYVPATQQEIRSDSPSNYPFRETVRIRYDGTVPVQPRYLGYQSVGEVFLKMMGDPGDPKTLWAWHYNIIRDVRIGRLRNTNLNLW